jgi:hypothetical protein
MIEYKIGDIVYRKNDRNKIGYEIIRIDNYTYKGKTLYIVSTDYSTLTWFSFEIGGLVRTKEENDKRLYNDELFMLGLICSFVVIVFLIIIF